uniref:uncharacterized protein tnfsf11 n=1 Tax=Pristiophorus japonicus TaxID=55135 RepID=UPI00398E8D65
MADPAARMASRGSPPPAAGLLAPVLCVSALQLAITVGFICYSQGHWLQKDVSGISGEFLQCLRLVSNHSSSAPRLSEVKGQEVSESCSQLLQELKQLVNQVTSSTTDKQQHKGAVSSHSRKSSPQLSVCAHLTVKKPVPGSPVHDLTLSNIILQHFTFLTAAGMVDRTDFPGGHCETRFQADGSSPSQNSDGAATRGATQPHRKTRAEDCNRTQETSLPCLTPLRGKTPSAKDEKIQPKELKSLKTRFPGLKGKLITSWEEKVGVAHLREMHYSQGSLRIKHQGLYYIYAQILFRYHADHPMSTREYQLIQYVYRKMASYPTPALILRGASTWCSGNHNLYSVYQGGVFNLHHGDEIFVTVSNISLVDVDEASSYLGAFKLD